MAVVVKVNIYSGSLFIQQALGWNIWYSILLLLGLTYLCSAIGGLAAVIYMDTVQFFIIVFGSLVVTVTGFMEVGGWRELTTRYLQAVPNETFPNTTCGMPRQDSWIMLRDPVDSDMPWPAFLLGQTPSSIWYWCADQMMVQRALAAKSLSHAQGGTLLAGYVKTLPVFLMVLPGMISRVLYTDEIACVKPEICQAVCNNPVSCSNSAYPRLVLGTMPEGFRGVMLAVMLAALMSDLCSVFNSASTLFTMDVWKRMRSRAATKELLIVSKVFAAFLLAVSIVWIPIIQQTQGGQLYIYIQSVSAYLAPPIAAIYCLAITVPRTNEKGAFWGLMVGLVFGLVRMALDFSYREPRCYEEDTRPAILGNLHYMYFAVLLFWTTIVLAVSISLLTDPEPEYRLIRTTYRTRNDKRRRGDDDSALRTEQQELINLTNRTVVTTVDQRKDASETIKVLVPNGTDVVVEPSPAKPSLFSRVWRWLCGVENNKERVQQALRNVKDPSVVNTLEQTEKEKWILNSCLAVIIALAVSLYAFFSINPLPAEEIERLRTEAFNRVLANMTSRS